MNVVEAWRGRAKHLRAQYRHCANCGSLAAVRRLSCTRCGADMSRAPLKRLPASVPVVAFSHAHLIVERMDQVERLDPVMLARVGEHQFMPLPLCESDAGLGPQLVGGELELALRRERRDGDLQDPIGYTRKLAATAASRAKLKRSEAKSK